MSRKVLAILTLLIIVGLTVLYVAQGAAILIGYFLCGVGGYALGALIAKK